MKKKRGGRHIVPTGANCAWEYIYCILYVSVCVSVMVESRKQKEDKCSLFTWGHLRYIYPSKCDFGVLVLCLSISILCDFLLLPHFQREILNLLHHLLTPSHLLWKGQQSNKVTTMTLHAIFRIKQKLISIYKCAKATNYRPETLTGDVEPTLAPQPWQQKTYWTIVAWIDDEYWAGSCHICSLRIHCRWPHTYAAGQTDLVSSCRRCQ